jgi:hypothetical protein
MMLLCWGSFGPAIIEGRDDNSPEILTGGNNKSLFGAEVIETCAEK